MWCVSLPYSLAVFSCLLRFCTMSIVCSASSSCWLVSCMVCGACLLCVCVQRCGMSSTKVVMPVYIVVSDAGECILRGVLRACCCLMN